jgi:hypothetical protein
MAMYPTGVKATLIPASEGKYEKATQTPGAFYYTVNQDGERVGLIHSCPCGCGLLGALNFDPEQKGKRPVWSRSGPDDAPTCSPSVGFHGTPQSVKGPDGYHWHGWLRNGVWESV